ncbi:hypothetical protein HID58_075253 [Brassica napus]|uniref:Uncharacterized protein n=1 Tax=Brassica napus TaxID=3708 RepID=A0ABQ7YJA0_BRANA|nr:hypothetical protein HID58_075253 [Brassica napus]
MSCKTKAETELAFRKMADALDNQQEVQRSGINKKESRSNEETKKDIIVIRGSGTRSVEKAVVRYDRDTRFRDENMEATPDRDPIAHAIYWEKKVQELRVRNAEMKQRRANETIQKQRLRNAEMQQRRANKTESRSIEETKGETVDMRPSGSGEKAVVRYDRDTRFWEDKMEQQRLSDALMQHMRSNEIVSRSTKETKGQTRPSGSGRWSPVVRYDRDTRSWEENREYLESSVRENKATQRDDEMQQRRSRETESIFSQQQKNRVDVKPKFTLFSIILLRVGDLTRGDMTQRCQRRGFGLDAEQCMGGGGWLSYDERRRNPATREILMRPPRRMEQRDREREVRNEGAS